MDELTDPLPVETDISLPTIEGPSGEEAVEVESNTIISTEELLIMVSSQLRKKKLDPPEFLNLVRIFLQLKKDTQPTVRKGKKAGRPVGSKGRTKEEKLKDMTNKLVKEIEQQNKLKAFNSKQEQHNGFPTD